MKRIDQRTGRRTQRAASGGPGTSECTEIIFAPKEQPVDLGAQKAANGVPGLRVHRNYHFKHSHSVAPIYIYI